MLTESLTQQPELENDQDPLRSYDELKFRSATHDLTLANPVCCHGVHG